MTGRVYMITNFFTGWVYIGATQLKIKYRFTGHIRSLEKGNHFIKRMQDDFDKYGKQSFIITELDTAEGRNELKEKEELWIKRYFGDGCYNTNDKVICHPYWF